MGKPISTQKQLLEAATNFEHINGRGWQATTRDWYNDRYEIRCVPSVAKALVRKGLLEVVGSGFNSIGEHTNRPIYRIKK